MRNIKRLRKRRGLSQQDIAKDLGLNNSSFVCNIEKDRKRIPPSRVEKLSKILKVDPVELIL